MGGCFPVAVGVEAGGIPLDGDDEDPLLLVGRVHREDEHQEEVRPHAADQDSPEKGRKTVGTSE